jgi:hypothetical protein
MRVCQISKIWFVFLRTFVPLVGRKGEEASFGFPAMHASNGIIEVVQGFPYRHTRPSEEIPGNANIATECCWEPI